MKIKASGDKIGCIFRCMLIRYIIAAGQRHFPDPAVDKTGGGFKYLSEDMARAEAERGCPA